MKRIGFARAHPTGQSLHVVTAPTRVLFACQHGSAKSLIAAELMRRLGAQRGVAVDLPTAYASKTREWNDVPAVSDGFAVARDAIANRARLLLDDIVASSTPNTRYRR